MTENTNNYKATDSHEKQKTVQQGGIKMQDNADPASTPSTEVEDDDEEEPKRAPEGADKKNPDVSGKPETNKPDSEETPEYQNPLHDGKPGVPKNTSELNPKAIPDALKTNGADKYKHDGANTHPTKGEKGN